MIESRPVAILPGTTDTILPIKDYESDSSIYDREIPLDAVDPERLIVVDNPAGGREESVDPLNFKQKFQEVLRPKQWMIFNCYYFGNYSQTAIAQMFGISQPVVNEMLRSSEARIRRKLGPLMQGFFDYKNRRTTANG